jgi:hypothetical protein
MAYDSITGNLADFNGTTSRYIFDTYNSQVRSHSNTTSMTWEVIYKKTGGADFQGIFGGKVGAGCSLYCNGGIYLQSNTFQANWYDNANYNFLNSGISPTLNQNHHVVVTFSGTDQRFRIYVDGILRATSGVTNNNYGGSQEVYDIGFNSKNAFGGGGDSVHVTGRIPIVRQYYNKALTATEVKQNYEAFKPRFSLL